jgi:hypothetical protein
MECGPRWGDGLSASNSARVERSPHPVSHFAALMRADPPPAGEGGNHIGRYARTSDGTLTPSLIWPTDLMMSSPSSCAKQA